MGCGFPVEAWKGKRILYVLGGIGSAALKATIEYTLEHRADYAGITILYGATHPTNFTYWYDVKEWRKFGPKSEEPALTQIACLRPSIHISVIENA